MSLSFRTLALTTAVVLLSSCAAMTDVETPAAPNPTPSVATSYDQLLADVRILSADDMEGRDTGSAGGERARAYIVSRLEALGIAAPPVGRLQPWTAQGRTRAGPRSYNGINVLGLVEGTRVPDRYIVVTAHYDHVGVNEGLIYNGADDNASGVATLLEIAARLKDAPPEHSVIFVAFDGEEHGLLGAKHFVEAPPVPLSSIAMNLNFDMTARAETDGHLWVTGTYQNPTFRPILEGIPANGTVSLAFGKDTPQDTGRDNWVQASDQGPFFTAGVPFLYLGVNYHPDYHRPSDDFERITPAVFISSTELSVSAFRALDRSLDR
ncbi:M20/M25/M40 family metallo-hydrolase [Brevundimonas sp. AJA228-03]|uniref:M20/M25/M40 family metallo-hydrolase n=1 Tax=Brevundimonas sp. AJA228-03 TaxID=2752515 RepID=UPI001AE0338E|nr:M20/M25/M40 family metallo-hydrolase [Brevundimonas sp. AJA228-03]QTN20806.1 M20/M25/M40 family metallo-hydrolase [Brevundimonas sp. AJA228-03]